MLHGQTQGRLDGHQSCLVPTSWSEVEPYLSHRHGKASLRHRPPQRISEAQRFHLRFLRPFRADLSIKKPSSFFPPLIAATSQRGLAPRPAQVSPDGPRYFGGTFLPFNALPLPRTTLRPPTTAMAPILSN